MTSVKVRTAVANIYYGEARRYLSKSAAVRSVKVAAAKRAVGCPANCDHFQDSETGAPGSCAWYDLPAEEQDAILSSIQVEFTADLPIPEPGEVEGSVML